jgi:hypothetical protein
VRSFLLLVCGFSLGWLWARLGSDAPPSTVGNPPISSERLVHNDHPVKTPQRSADIPAQVPFQAYAPEWKQPTWYDELRELNAQLGRLAGVLALMLPGFAFSFSIGPMLGQVTQFIQMHPAVDLSYAVRAIMMLLLAATALTILGSFVLVFGGLVPAIPGYTWDLKACRRLLQDKRRACDRTVNWMFAGILVYMAPWAILFFDVVSKTSRSQSSESSVAFIQFLVGASSLYVGIRLTIWRAGRREIRFMQQELPKIEAFNLRLMVLLVTVLSLGRLRPGKAEPKLGLRSDPSKKP